MSPSSTLDLLIRAQESLADAYGAPGTAQRHLAARMAALRAAAAVIAARGGGSRESGPTDPWVLLVRLAPELSEWADYFSLVAERGAELTTLRATVGVREADDLLRAAESFVAEVSPLLGLPFPVQRAGRLAPVHVTAAGGASGWECDVGRSAGAVGVGRLAGREGNPSHVARGGRAGQVGRASSTPTGAERGYEDVGLAERVARRSA